jgi:hypothetical protein
MKDNAELKAALYLRKSEGEKGNTEKQLRRIMPHVEDLEKRKAILPLNRDIVGKDITRKQKFNAKRDLAKIGDVYNEGERRSAFGKPETRPVLMELFRRVRAGEYDAILFEDMTRFSRDPAEMMGVAIDLWRQDGKYFHSLTEPSMGYYPNDEIREAMTTATLMFGSLAKKGEIKKAEDERLGDSLDRGWFKGGMPELIGSGTKGAGLDYRKAWRLMEAFGENPKSGNPNSPSAIALEMNKKTWNEKRQTYVGDNAWTNRWYKKMKGWNELKVLDNWLNLVEGMNDYISSRGKSAGASFKQKEVKNILSSAAGFFSYPAGVNPAATTEFIVFPNPLDIGLELLAENENPMDIEKWNVKRTKISQKKIDDLPIVQTQPRSGKK